MNYRRPQLLAVGSLCAITLAAWANSFACDFVFDNRVLVLGDTRVRTATLENIELIFSRTYWWPNAVRGLYRPVTTLSYLFNYGILGNADHPAGYHWINLLLHMGNVLLVFALARRLVKDYWAPFLIAAIWAVHPVLTESVTNIVGRADLLAGMATLGGLLIYLRSMGTSGVRRLAWLAGLTAITTVGVFSKESAVAVAGIIALYELTWWDRRRIYGFFEACLAMSPAFLAMWWTRSRVLATAPAADFQFMDNPIVGADFWTGRLTAVKVMALYLERLVWPVHLSADYSYAQIPLADGRLTDWIAWGVVAGAAIGVALLFRRNKAAFFAAGLAFLTLLPASNLVIPVGTIMAERFLYLPAIGLAVCLVLAVNSASRRVRAGAAAPVVMCLLITAGFGVRTWARNPDWRDDLAFWSAGVRTSPLSFKTHLGLSQALRDRGLPEQAGVEEVRGLAVLDTVPNALNDAGFYIRPASRFLVEGDMLTPPANVADYKRAKALLLRGQSILRAQQGKPLRADLEILVKKILEQTDLRLEKASQPLPSTR